MKFLDITGLKHFLDKLKSLRGANNGFAGLDKNGHVGDNQIIYQSKEVIYFTKQVNSTTMSVTIGSLLNPKYVVFDKSKKRFVATSSVSSSSYTNCQSSWTQTSEAAYKPSSSFGSQDTSASSNGVIPKKDVVYYDEEEKKTYIWSGSELIETDYYIDSEKSVRHVFFNMASSLTSPGTTLSHDVTVGDNKFGLFFTGPLAAQFTTYPDPINKSGSDVQTIKISMPPASASTNGFMTMTQASQLNSLYTAHGGKTYLPTSGGTVTGYTTFSNGLASNNGMTVKNGGLEIYNTTTPYIDFHYGNSTADYTSRIIESANGVLTINNIKFDKNHGMVVPVNYYTKYESWLAESYINDFGGKAECSFQVYTSNGEWRFVRQTKAKVDTADGTGDYAYIVCLANKNLQLGNQRTTVNYSDGSITTPKVTQTSDERLKENICLITDDLDKIANVNFKEFNYKKDDNKVKSYGVIAQDLEKAGLCNLVVEDDNGYKAVDYTALIMLELQRLRTEIEDLKAAYNGNN